jgi:hypothetical protein
MSGSPTKIWRIGDTFSRQWQFYSVAPNATNVNGIPVSLVGCQASFGIVNQKTGATLYQANTTDTNSALVITDALNGIIKLEVPKNISEEFVVGVYVMGLQIDYPDGTSITYNAQLVSIMYQIAGKS